MNRVLAKLWRALCAELERGCQYPGSEKAGPLARWCDAGRGDACGGRAMIVIVRGGSSVMRTAAREQVRLANPSGHGQPREPGRQTP